MRIGVLRTVAGARLAFHCPGCGFAHVIAASQETRPDAAQWSWNGDYERPTFAPSILVQGADASGPTVCHSFVRDGMIQFLPDCTHHLAGQTVPLTSSED